MDKLTHRFVKSAPNELEEGIIYISMEYSSALHKCACGCGEIVVTPFSRNDWKLIFDGETISLTPSIGNWRFKCRSHYWIFNNEIKWIPENDEEKVDIVSNKNESRVVSFIKSLFRKS